MYRYVVYLDHFTNKYVFLYSKFLSHDKLAEIATEAFRYAKMNSTTFIEEMEKRDFEYQRDTLEGGITLINTDNIL